MDVALNQMRLITHLLVQPSASFSFHLIVLLYSAPPHTHTLYVQTVLHEAFPAVTL